MRALDLLDGPLRPPAALGVERHLVAELQGGCFHNFPSGAIFRTTSNRLRGGFVTVQVR